MRNIIFTTLLVSVMVALPSCKKNNANEINVLYLHHSTGRIIWGIETSVLTKVAWRFNKLYDFLGRNAILPALFNEYNKKNGTFYSISKRPFPKTRPYGWHNYPYDYYNIWVKNAGNKKFKKEPTLEILTKKYDVILFKHCFPSSNVNADSETPNIDSDYKSIANYKLQYEALKQKMHQFPDTKFIVWTGAANVEANTNQENAERGREFFEWVKQVWDEKEDNIFIWDFYELQTEGGIYFKEEYAESNTDSHPNMDFANKVAPLLFNRIIDVIENDGNNTNLEGQKI